MVLQQLPENLSRYVKLDRLKEKLEEKCGSDKQFNITLKRKIYSFEVPKTVVFSKDDIAYIAPDYRET